MSPHPVDYVVGKWAYDKSNDHTSDYVKTVMQIISVAMFNSVIYSPRFQLMAGLTDEGFVAVIRGEVRLMKRTIFATNLLL